MEFDDIIKRRIIELEEFLRRMIEGSDKFSEMRDILSDTGYNAVLCMMTLIYKPGESSPFDLENDFFEEEIDEKLDNDFLDIVCEDDKGFLKKLQDKLDY